MSRKLIYVAADQPTPTCPCCGAAAEEEGFGRISFSCGAEYESVPSTWSGGDVFRQISPCPAAADDDGDDDDGLHEPPQCLHCCLVMEDWDDVGEAGLCRRCTDQAEVSRWIDETCEAVERLADRYGWDAGEWEHSRETRSRYVLLSRGSETLRVRVSDHASCYETEDYSIEIHGRDHTLGQLEGRLAAPPEEEEE